MKEGKSIEVRGWTMSGEETWERAKIMRWNKSNGPRDSLTAGWHPVRFADGGSMMIHESRMRVVSDRI